MKGFYDNFDFLKQATHDNEELIADDCTMEWPFFSWRGKKSIQQVLQQINNHCSTQELIFSEINKDTSNGTCLYKLTQATKPTLWCGIWTTIHLGKIKHIKLIFDSFEYFTDNKTVDIFGFHKDLDHTVTNEIVNNDKEIITIMNAIKDFFQTKYGIPLQDTPLSRKRLYQTATNAKNQLKTNAKYTITLPFFSANEKGPIQFFATMTKTAHSYEIT